MTALAEVGIASFLRRGCGGWSFEVNHPLMEEVEVRSSVHLPFGHLILFTFPTTAPKLCSKGQFGGKCVEVTEDLQRRTASAVTR